jgi:hypothetical protein
MFNLETAIAEWRRQMMAAGIESREVLDELECHLRDDIEQQLRLGTEQCKAFESAAARIGEARSLRHEFEKAVKTKTGLFWKLKSLLTKTPDVPWSVPDALTQEGIIALEAGRAEALCFHHDFIGTEHVLLGLLAAETSSASNVLRKMGVSRETVRVQIERIVGSGPKSHNAQSLPYTPRAKRALELAAREARCLHNNHVDPRHIFLGLLLEGHGVAALVLKSLGVDVQKVRSEIEREC